MKNLKYLLAVWLSVHGAPWVLAQEAVTVNLEPVERETVLDAVLEAVNQSTVAAQTSARVEEIMFDVGDYVEKNTVIIRFSDTEQRSRLERAEASLAEARARQADGQANYNRVKEIYDRGLLSKAEFDKASADLISLRSRVESAQAAVNEAKKGLDYTVVRAPYSGIVVERHIEMGETAVAGQPLMTGLSLEHLRAAADIPQHAITPLRQQGRARVILPDGNSVESTELRIPPNADPTTHTFRVLVTLPVNDYGMFPGMLVKVAFTSRIEEQLLVPAQALVQRSEITAVYIIDAGGGITFRYVRAGTPAADGRIPILSGLGGGEQVAIDPIAAGVAYRQQSASTRE